MSWCNTIKDLFGRIRASIKTGDMYLELFNMIQGINESTTFGEHILCKCKCVDKTRTMRSLSVSVKSL